MYVEFTVVYHEIWPEHSQIKNKSVSVNSFTLNTFLMVVSNTICYTTNRNKRKC